DYNGLKFVREQAKPISAASGLLDIEARTWHNDFTIAAQPGKRRPLAHRPGYIDFLLGEIRHDVLKPLKIVANAGNGCAGLVAEPLAEHLPFDIVPVFFQPDGDLPNGIPNPLLPENRAATAEAVRAHGADFGVAWD